MEPEELLKMLVSYRGPCMRICAYCPEDYKTAEVKECVQGLIKKNYELNQMVDDLEKDVITLRRQAESGMAKAYWKHKFNEVMCSECFFPIEDKDVTNFRYCPGCGRLMEE